MRNNHQNGAALIALALLFALVGILFGLGRLKAYEYQVARRVNRQYQIEKMLVTRSALALVKYECAPDCSAAGLPAYTNLIYRSPQSGVTLTCDVTPVPILPDASAWNTCCLSNGSVVAENATVTLTGASAGHGPAAAFAVACAASNTLYTCALFKPAERYWRQSTFGYLYRLQMASGGADTGFDKLRLYLVGTAPGAVMTAANYVSLMATCPSIMMELSLENGTTNALRTLRVNNDHGAVQVPFPDAPFLTGAAQQADALTHGGGFQLSAAALVGFGEGASPPHCVANNEYADLNFSTNRINLSPLIDLSPLVDSGSFSSAWIVIENQFATNLPGQPLSVSVSPFIMREPQTYAISVYASALATHTNRTPRLMTWVFQTKFPVPGAAGLQCVLDTFGVEPASLRNERKGLLPGE